MASTRTFDPFLISEELEVRVRAFTNVIDGAQLVFPRSDLGDPPIEVAYDLGAHEWSRLHVAVDVQVPIASLKIVLGDREPADVAVALVEIACRSTKVRRSIGLERVADGRWQGGVELARDSLANLVTLAPRIALTTDVDHGAAGSDLASSRGEIVAQGRPIALRVDHVESGFRGGLDVRWEDFRASTDPWRKSHTSDVYSMDFGAPEPVLWLNERHVNLKAVLHGDARTPLDVAIKRVAIGLIGQGAWHQLFSTATADLVASGDEEAAGEPPAGWRGAVLDKLLPDMYPELPKAQRFDRLQVDLGAEAAPGALATRLGTAIQANLKVGDALLGAVRAVDREVDA